MAKGIPKELADLLLAYHHNPRRFFSLFPAHHPRRLTVDDGDHYVDGLAEVRKFFAGLPSKRHKQPLTFSAAGHRATCATCPVPIRV